MTSGGESRLFGMDLDDLLGYTTRKVVFIRDRAIGSFYYSVVGLVVVWVLGVQILYRNEQFVLKDVSGLARIWVSHPTLKHCDSGDPACKSDYRSLKELPYCNEYAGIGSAGLSHKGFCKYEDSTSLLPDGEVDNKVFIPTAVEIVTERRSCKPSAENGYTCDNEYEEMPGSDCLQGKQLCRTRGNLTDQFYYVADVMSSTVQLTSSYEQGSVHGSSLEHPAYYEQCRSPLRGPGTVKSWNDRLVSSSDAHEGSACSAGMEMVVLPCQEGVDCSTRIDFDMYKDSGLGHTVNDASNITEDIQDGVDRIKDAAAEKMKDIVVTQSPSAEQSGAQDEQEVRLHSAGEQRVRKEIEEILRAEDKAQQKSKRIKNPVLLQAPPGSQEPQQLAARRTRAGRSQESHGQLRLSTSSSEAGAAAKDRVPSKLRFDPYTTQHGDVFPLGKLLEMAGMDLDMDLNGERWPSRQSGTVIEIRCVYNNMYHFLSTFGYKDVEYHYSVSELPLPEMSRKTLAPVQPPDYPETRRYEVRHGVLIWLKVDGEFGVFNIVYLLLMLVTASALLGAATAVTDIIAIYVHPRKDNYFRLKYEVSPDFSDDMVSCPECGFRNIAGVDQTCRGIPQWACAATTQVCGAKLPAAASAPSVARQATP